MRLYNSYKVWFTGFLLVLLTVGCGKTTVPPVIPTVVSISPTTSSTSACPTATVTATFSGTMTASTINGSTITLAGPGTTAVAGTVSYNGTTNTATFTPSANLTANVTYTVTITTGVQDLHGVALAGNYVSAFKTAADGCNPTPPPSVVSVSPVAGSMTSCPTVTASVTFFNEAMNPSTINATTILVTGPGSTAVAGAVTYNATTDTAVFTPSSPLIANTTYTGIATTGTQDTFGNALPANYSWTFATAANGCRPAPTVTLTPANGSATACPNTPIVATFSLPMNPATVNATTFSLSPAVVSTITHNATSTIFTLTPSSSLAAATTYTATVTTGAQDAVGDALASNTASSFKTATSGCHAAPTVTSVTPANAATGACPNRVVTLAFSEAMNTATINTSSVTLTGPSGAVSGLVVYNPVSNSAIFTPLSVLALNGKYTVTVTTAAQDTFGDPLAANFTSTFTTGASACLPAAPPVLVMPANAATAVCPSAVVSATFLEVMNPATLNSTTFTVTNPAGTAIPGAITSDSTSRMYTFTPTAALSVSTAYIATITTGATDSLGDPLASNYSWSFTTAAAACAAPVPTITAVYPLANSTTACPNVGVTAAFSEAMDPTTINATTFTISPNVTGTVALDSTARLGTFTPTTALALSTPYTATITTGARDPLGTPLAANYVWNFTTAAVACQVPILLGPASTYAVLAGTTVTSTGATMLTGDLGLFPGVSVTGFPPGTLTGTENVTNQAAAEAQLDLTTWYTYAAGLTGGAALPGDLSGLTITPGLYKNASAVALSTGTLTLDAQGDSNATFIFQLGTTLTTASATQIVLANGAQASNVFWQVGSSATLGSASTFQGTILASKSITVNTGVILQGRALARSGAVTMDTDAVTVP